MRSPEFSTNLAIVVERVKEKSKAIPRSTATESIAFLHPVGGVPKCLERIKD